jgi:hypothetical protein
MAASRSALMPIDKVSSDRPRMFIWSNRSLAFINTAQAATKVGWTSPNCWPLPSVKNKASDLHLSAGLPPMIRVHGDVRRINLPAMEHKDVHSMVYDIMNDGQRKIYEEPGVRLLL